MEALAQNRIERRIFDVVNQGVKSVFAFHWWMFKVWTGNVGLAGWSTVT